jgi:putative membrane protein (TIGR04086 family)
MVSNLKANIMILITGAIISLIILLGLNLILNFNEFSDSKIDLFTFIASILIFFFLGLLAGNIKQKSGLVNGVLFSTVFVVIFIVISIFTKTLDFSHIVRYIIMILTGGLGGIIGVNFKPIVK